MGIPNGKQVDEDKVNIRMFKIEILRRRAICFLESWIQITERRLFCCVTMIANGIYLHKENSKKMNAM